MILKKYETVWNEVGTLNLSGAKLSDQNGSIYWLII